MLSIQMMLANVRHILPTTRIRRQRILRGSGRVLVRKGQKVNTVDAIAEANLEPQHLLLDVARALGLPASKVDAQIQRRPGESIAEGDVLAGPVGWAKRVLRAPRSGRVIMAGKGKILLEAETQPFQLLAGFPGVVVSLIPERGAVIETNGALVQGVWGNGRIDSGLLRIAIHRPEDVLTSDRLDISLRGAVLLAGYCNDASVLRGAGELPLRGLILSSMEAALVPEALSAPFPIVVLDGFGLLPMNGAAYQLLTTQEGRDTALNAETADPLSAQRPEVVIGLPLGGPLDSPQEVVDFAPGQRVHVLRAPYQGQIGTIIAIKPGVETFASGVKAPAAQVRLENGESASLPLVNLEVLV
jgi:hypothetical protein